MDMSNWFVSPNHFKYILNILPSIDRYLQVWKQSHLFEITKYDCIIYGDI